MRPNLFFDNIQTNKKTGCWEWTGSNDGKPKPYGHACYNGKPGKAHRIMWEIFNGPIKGNLSVLHMCDNTLCVRPDHLFLGTHQDNMRDMINKGRRRVIRGDAHPKAKITWSEVQEMRRLYSLGMRETEIKKLFPHGPKCINRIVRNLTWRFKSRLDADV